MIKGVKELELDIQCDTDYLNPNPIENADAYPNDYSESDQYAVFINFLQVGEKNGV